MAYTLTLNSKVSQARKPIADGEYSATIVRLEQPTDKNPYIVFTIADGRELRFYINSDVALDIITSNINSQLEIEVNEDTDIFSWFEDVKGSQVTLWVLTTEGTDKNGQPTQYHNVTPYKPAMFDAIVNGLL